MVRLWQGLGFSFGTAIHPWPAGNERAEFWLIPYWVLVLSMTLASAFLILWKPRRSGIGKSN